MRSRLIGWSSSMCSLALYTARDSNADSPREWRGSAGRAQPLRWALTQLVGRPKVEAGRHDRLLLMRMARVRRQLLVGWVFSAQPPLRARVRVALAIRAEHPPLSRALVDAPAPGREMALVWLELGLGLGLGVRF